MKTDPTLAEKREELRKQIEMYRSLPEYVLDGIGAFVSRSKLRVTPRSRKVKDFPLIG